MHSLSIDPSLDRIINIMENKLQGPHLWWWISLNLWCFLKMHGIDVIDKSMVLMLLIKICPNKFVQIKIKILKMERIVLSLDI